jgi:hypothetical protein
MTSSFLQVGRTIASRPTHFALTGDKGCPHLHLADMQAFLPMFIFDAYKKGMKPKERNKAILHITLFLDWCKKNVKKQ